MTAKIWLNGSGAAPMPWREAMPIARQIADALAAAHDAGIVHRDLKPANIKVRDDGTVKVLDFGLAKGACRRDAEGRSNGAELATATMTSPAMTAMGMILGTAAYMSPEQAKGRPVDRRADVWAFGVVLYEMLTGAYLFGRDGVTETLAAVLTHEPDLTKLPADTPPSVRRLLARCLTKDKRERLDSMTVARIEIEESANSREAAAPAPGASSRWIAPALAAGSSCSASVGPRRRSSLQVPGPLVRLPPSQSSAPLRRPRRRSQPFITASSSLPTGACSRSSHATNLAFVRCGRGA